MDWTKQANEMLKTWTGTQQKVWETWMGSMQTMTVAPGPEAWQKVIETWRGTVTQALESQVQLTRLWSESVAAVPSTMNVPPPAGMEEWTKGMVELTRALTDTQVRFSENWFDLLKKADPAVMAQVWTPAQAQKIMETLQEATKKAAEAQTEWSKMVTSAMGTVNNVEKVEK